jgi:hypothetical protein
MANLLQSWPLGGELSQHLYPETSASRRCIFDTLLSKAGAKQQPLDGVAATHGALSPLIPGPLDIVMCSLAPALALDFRVP